MAIPKIILVSLMFYLALTLSAFAQIPTSVSVDYNKAKISWTYPAAKITNVSTFIISCTSTSGDVVHVVMAPTVTVPLLDFITVVGSYTCVVVAENEFGTSGPSNSVLFKAGVSPIDPTLLLIEST